MMSYMISLFESFSDRERWKLLVAVTFKLQQQYLYVIILSIRLGINTQCDIFRKTNIRIAVLYFDSRLKEIVNVYYMKGLLI